jgi:hypothetical protein
MQDSELRREFHGTLLSLRIIFLTLLFAQIVLAAVVFLLIRSPITSAFSDTPLLLDLLLPVLVVFETLLASVLASRRMEMLGNEPDPFVRLQLYKMTCLLKWAMLEGASFLAMVGFLLSHSLLYPLMAVILVVLFLFNRPTAYRLQELAAVKMQE